MPRLPTADDLGGLPSGRSGRPIATYDTSAIGAGIADFGRGISQLAAGLDANRKRLEAAQTEARFQALMTQEATTWDAAQQNMPVGGAGFAESYVTSAVKPLARSFLEPLSPELQAEYGPRLAALLRSRVTGGLNVEHAETLRYGQQVTADNLNNNILPRSASVQTEEQMNGLIADADRAIDLQPGLTPVQREEEKRAARERIQKARLEALTPQAQIEALGTVAITPETRAFIAARGANLDFNGVNPTFASRLQTAVTAAEAATGQKAQINDLHRDPKRQAQYYANYTGRPVTWEGVTYQPTGRGGLAAPPGRSRHQSGQAADIQRGPVLEWLHAHAGEYGLEFLEGRAFSNDPGHMQMAGGAAPTGASAPVFSDAIPYEQRATYAEAAQKEINAARTVYAGGVADAAAYVRAGNPVPPEYAPEAIAANLGATPAAANAAREMGQAVEYAATADAVAFATPEEVQGIVANTMAELNNPQSPVDYIDRQKQAEDLVKIVTDRNTALADNPAGYVQQDTNVGAAWDAYLAAATKSDGTIADVARASAGYSALALQMQDRLGVPPSEQRLLSPQAGAAIVEQFKSGGEEGGQNPAAFVRALSAQWGSNWPRVFGELADKLPGTVLVIGAMDAPGQELAAERLAEASMAGKSALEELFSNEDVTKVSEALIPALQDFQGTLAATAGGGVRTYGAFSEATRLLAYSYMQQGDSPQGAVDKAVADILGRKYEFRGTFRVPKDYDADTVSRGAAAALNNLDPAGLDLPQSAMGLNEEETRTAYVDGLRDTGFWVTSPNEDGLTLYEGTTRAVVTRNGEPILVPWADITKAAVASGLVDTPFGPRPPVYSPLASRPPSLGARIGAELGQALRGGDAFPTPPEGASAELKRDWSTLTPDVREYLFDNPDDYSPGEATPIPATRMQRLPNGNFVPEGQTPLPGDAAFPPNAMRSGAPTTVNVEAMPPLKPGDPARWHAEDGGFWEFAPDVEQPLSGGPAIPGNRTGRRF